MYERPGATSGLSTRIDSPRWSPQLCPQHRTSPSAMQMQPQTAFAIPFHHVWIVSVPCLRNPPVSHLLIRGSLTGSVNNAPRSGINYYQEKLSNTSDTRKLFSTFKSLIYPPSPPPSTSLTADNFSDFFNNKVAAISSQFSPPDDDIHLTSSNTALLSSFAILTEDDVSTLLLSNHPTTCTLDPIPSTLLQAVAPALMPAITQVINTSLKTGTFPTSFKQALITPLLKKPSLDPSVVENYRPVSLLPFLAKTMEQAVFNQLSDFLSKNNLLNVNQSGFKRGHATETALLTVVEYLGAAKATGQSSVLILLYLSSAFDTVNHQILLSTLSYLGISGSALDWLCSYLSGRTFKVSWWGYLSHSHSLSTGVPQGSVLGPLLFSIYTSSLGAIIHSHGLSYHCYADDTQLFLSFPPDDSTVSSRISACLSDISAWMSERHLQLNLSKTEVLVFPARTLMKHNIRINIGSTVIVPTNSAKNLGVIIDDQLSFKDHISSVSRAADLLSTTSGRSDPTSRNIQPNSLYRRWSHLVLITATLC
ncbi:hypothetical protein Q8A73_012543 [Channa argus]|nr:hypothetical protein Q8A73_012543 [Channa argus]